MAKFIQVQFDDGIWRIPAEVVAMDRAKELATDDTRDLTEKFPNEIAAIRQAIYDQEYEYTLSDDFEIMDWLRNNMNWDQLEASAFRFKPLTPRDYSNMWADESSEGRVKVVTIE